MDTKDKDWLAEIERRAAVYDALAGDDTGRLGMVDWVGMLALALGLTLVFWVWAV